MKKNSLQLKYFFTFSTSSNNTSDLTKSILLITQIKNLLLDIFLLLKASAISKVLLSRS